MDATSIRDQLNETRARLEQVEEEREILTTLIAGFEGWLRLHPIAAAVTATASLPPVSHQNFAKGTISLRAAIRQALEESVGEVVHTRDLYHRALALGAITESKQPLNVVDLHLAHLRKNMDIEVLGQRRWRLEHLGPSIAKEQIALTQ